MVIFSRILGVCFLLPLFAFGAIIEAENIVETVDISSLQFANINVAFQLPSFYVATLSEAAIANRCAVLSTVSSCTPTVIVDTGTVNFNMVEPLDIRVENFKIGEDNVRVNLFMNYEPKQFALINGIAVRRRELKIQYPTHMTIITDVLARPLGATFTLTGTRHRTPLILERTQFETGEAIPIPSFEGKLCIATLAQGERALLKESAVGCGPFSLGTTSFVPEGKYDLYVLAIQRSGITVAEVPIELTWPKVRIDARPSRTSLVLGEKITVELSSAPPLEGCVVSVLDMNGIRVDQMNLRKCTTIPIGTQSSWTPGKYLVRIEGIVGTSRGQATFTLNLRGRGYAPATTKTDKGSYVAGEPISIHIDAQGDYCEIELFDEDNTKVGEGDSPGCGNAQIKTDESLTNGSYVVRTKVYRDGNLKAVSSRGIEILEWRPPVRSPRADLCRGGFLYIDHFKLPCVATGDICIPSSTSLPACLCFDGAGELVSPCRFGYRCAPSGCSERVVESAYIVIREGGRCIAKRGLERVSCVEAGEICSGTCVCLDKESKPISSCSLGQTCTVSGCQDMRLEMEVRSYEDHVRTDRLEEGIGLDITGHITYQVGGVERQLMDTDRAEIIITSSLGTLEADTVDMRYMSGAEGWTVTPQFTGSLDPGTYELFLIVEYREDVHVIRRPFQVWYPEEMQNLGVKINSVSPLSMSITSIKKGGTVELVAKVVDREGQNLPHLPPEAFSVAVGQIPAYAVGSTFNPTSGLWTVIGNFRNETVQRSDTITLTLSSLGREGSAREGFDVVDQVQLSLRIGRVTPGTKDKPLFYLFATVGFDMDIFTTVEGAVSVRKEDFTIKIGRHDVSENIAYLVSTAEGIRIHLSEVHLCPDPPLPNSDLSVTTKVRASGQSSQDSVPIRLQGNPGNWRDMKGDVC